MDIYVTYDQLTPAQKAQVRATFSFTLSGNPNEFYLYVVGRAGVLARKHKRHFSKADIAKAERGELEASY